MDETNIDRRQFIAAAVAGAAVGPAIVEERKEDPSMSCVSRGREMTYFFHFKDSIVISNVVDGVIVSKHRMSLEKCEALARGRTV